MRSSATSTRKPLVATTREHVGKPFYESLIDHITRSPVLLAVVEGPVGTWQVVRNTMGATNPAQAQPGTIRGDLALSMTENLIHGSDSAESAGREIALFFGSLQPLAGELWHDRS